MNVLQHAALPAMLALGLSLPAAQAASTFNSDATLTYTITGISPGDLAGLTILGSFQQAGEPDSQVALSGDGAVVANNPSFGPAAVTTTFSHSFAVSGSASDGAVQSSHLGNFSLSFSNASANTYAIELSLAYVLNAHVGGEFADSSVSLDYFNADSSFSGFDTITANTADVTDATRNDGLALYSFTLAPNATQALLGDVAITGTLQATPVPVPVAAWLFGSALGLFGFARRRA
ncbi:MAG: hypothetical protein ACKN9T_04370 [Candidatus Methylumidiphilus sp.]